MRAPGGTAFGDVRGRVEERLQSHSVSGESQGYEMRYLLLKDQGNAESKDMR